MAADSLFESEADGAHPVWDNGVHVAGSPAVGLRGTKKQLVQDVVNGQPAAASPEAVQEIEDDRLAGLALLSGEGISNPGHEVERLAVARASDAPNPLRGDGRERAFQLRGVGGQIAGSLRPRSTARRASASCGGRRAVVGHDRATAVDWVPEMHAAQTTTKAATRTQHRNLRCEGIGGAYARSAESQA